MAFPLQTYAHTFRPTVTVYEEFAPRPTVTTILQQAVPRASERRDSISSPDIADMLLSLFWFKLLLSAAALFLVGLLATGLYLCIRRRRQQPKGLPLFDFGQKHGMGGERLVEAGLEAYDKRQAATAGQVQSSPTAVRPSHSPTSVDPAPLPPSRPAPATTTTARNIS